MNTDGTPFLNSDHAAVLLGLSYSKLNRYISKDDGPVFDPFAHRILYHGTDLEAWAEERRITSTSNYGGNWHICPNTGGGGTGSAVDPSLETVVPAARQKDASYG